MYVLRVDTADGDYFVGMKGGLPCVSRREYERFPTQEAAYKFTKGHNLSGLLDGERPVHLSVEVDPEVIKARECARVIF